MNLFTLFVPVRAFDGTRGGSGRTSVRICAVLVGVLEALEYDWAVLACQRVDAQAAALAFDVRRDGGFCLGCRAHHRALGAVRVVACGEAPPDEPFHVVCAGACI